MGKKWSAFVSSTSGTDDCLTTVRNGIKEHFEQLGLHIMLSESPDFPNFGGRSVVETCETVIRECDFFILLIDNQYGTVLGDGMSFTQREYNVAKRYGIPSIILIEQNLYSEYMELSRHKKKDVFCTEQDNVKDKRKVFGFIDALYSLENTQKEIIHPVYFPGKILTDDENKKRFEEIYKIICNQINGFAGFHLKKVMEKQKKQIQKELSTRLFPKVYTDKKDIIYPSFKFKGIEEEFGILKKIFENSKKNSEVFLYGDAGSGKSTIMKLAFLYFVKLYQQNNNKKSLPIPIFLNFRDRGTEFSFSSKDLYEREYDYPFFLQEEKDIPIEVFLFGDSLEEASNLSSDDAFNILNGIRGMNPITINGFVISLRSWLFKSLSERLSNITDIQILGWNKKQLKEFIDYRDKIKKFDSTEKESLKIIFNHLYKATEKYYPPFYVLLILELFEGNNTEANSSSINSIGAVLYNCVRGRCLKEIKKYNIYKPFETVDKLHRIIIEFGWKIKLLNVSATPYTPDDIIRDIIKSNHSPICFELVKNTISTLYVLNFKADPIHKLFEEYLIAEKFITLLTEGTDNDDFYKGLSILSSESNRMVSDLIKLKGRSDLIETIVNNLISEYNKLQQCEHGKKLLILYTIPRFGTFIRGLMPRIIEFYKNQLILCDEKRQEDSNFNIELVAMLIWLTIFGDFDAEKIYYNKIFNDNDFDEINRGCHMIYLKDVKSSFGYRDIYGQSWNSTAESFIEHFTDSNDKRHRLIRRIDLAILRSFIIAHKNVPIKLKEYFNGMTEEDLIDMTMNSAFDESGIPFKSFLLEKLKREKKGEQEEVESFEKRLTEEFKKLKEEIAKY